MISMWQQILLRGQQTLAVWLQHAAAFTVRGLTLAQHQTNVNALAPKAQQVEDAQEVVDDARAARDAVQAEVASLNTRLARKLDGELLPNDPYHADLEDVRTVPSDSGPNILKRGQKVLALWKKLNARNAAASPVIPALLVGGVAIAAFQAKVESLPGLQQTVEEAESALRDRRKELRTLSATVDEANKRWYAAWQGEFLPGSPEYEALSQIDTGSSGGGEEEPPPPPPAPEPPGAPQNVGLVLGAAESGEAGISSDGASGTVDGYKLFNNGVEVASSATLPVIGTFTPGDVLNLTLRAFNAGGNSDPSDTVPGTAP